MPSYKPEAIENAFKAWRRSGQNIEATLRELKQQGYNGISRPTIYDWMDKYGWKDRAARADAEEHRVADVELSIDERILADLLKQKARYDRFFAALPETAVDTQATYAYASLLKTIKDIQAKTGTDKPALILEMLEGLIDYLSEKAPEIAEQLDGHLDGFIARIKGKA